MQKKLFQVNHDFSSCQKCSLDWLKQSLQKSTQEEKRFNRDVVLLQEKGKRERHTRGMMTFNQTNGIKR